MTWSSIFDPVTSFFTAIMLVYFVYAWVYLNNPKDRFQAHFATNAAGGIASFGVLGTFTGIFLGLAEFDANDIAGSVPILLGGMKTAFVTSITGMAFSTWYKFLQSLKENKK